MRKPWLLVIFAVAWVLACGGSSSSPASPTTGGSQGSSGASVKCTAANLGSGVALAHGTMSAQIDGVTWTADCIGAVVKQLSQSSQSLQIVGADYNNDKTRVLGIDVKTGVGTTNIGGLLVVALSDAWVGDAKSWSSVGQSSGSLTMTAETTNSATGTFTFTLPPLTVSGASGAATIANGAFNITF